jgi:peptidoglycan/LPS O-acetylase OafA/YrhL
MRQTPEPPVGEDQNRSEPALAPPVGNPRFPLVDSLRAIAVGAVFWSHAGTYWWNAYFNVGVTIFFAISAFLLYRPYAAARVLDRPQIGVRGYAVRRSLRIVPAYWLALLGVVVSMGFASEALHQLPRSMLFLQVYSPHTIFNLIPAAWSLCVEVVFYLALPFYALAVRNWAGGADGLRRELWLLATIAVASVAFRGLIEGTAGGYTVLADGTVPGTALWFAVGMAAAAISVDAESEQLRGPVARRFLNVPPGAWCWPSSSRSTSPSPRRFLSIRSIRLRAP